MQFQHFYSVIHIIHTFDADIACRLLNHELPHPHQLAHFNNLSLGKVWFMQWSSLFYCIEMK